MSYITIAYDHELSTEEDAGVYEIKYTVFLVEYEDMMVSSAIEGSFRFEIESVCSETYLIENQSIPSLYSIRMLDPRLQSYRYKAYSDSISLTSGIN